MAKTEKNKSKMGIKPGDTKGIQAPEWSDGLKRLYDSVVEEPLPDSFKELLSRLDDSGK
jgi:hypothetical protein